MKGRPDLPRGKTRVMDMITSMEAHLLLEGRGLRRSFPSGRRRKPVEALQGVDIQVRSGEVTALLGPNGSGKTTLLHCLLGILSPHGGEARLFGLPPGDPAGLRRTGFLPEEDPPWGNLRGREVLEFTARLHGMGKSEARERAGSLLAELGLEEAGGRKFKGYSKGMARRLGLASALIHDPDLLVLDEPTAGLDPLGSALVLEKLLDCKSRGKGILLASHVFREVEALADQVVVLSKGRAAARGPAMEVLADPGTWELQVKGLDQEGKERLTRLAGELGRIVKSGPALRGLDEVLRLFGREDSAP